MISNTLSLLVKDKVSYLGGIFAKLSTKDNFVDIVLDKTPFYAECGGQVGDSGIIESENLKAEVLTTFKVNDLYVHRCELLNGEVVSVDGGYWN